MSISDILAKLGLTGDKKPASVQAEAQALADALAQEQSAHETTKASLDSIQAELTAANDSISKHAGAIASKDSEISALNTKLTEATAKLGTLDIEVEKKAAAIAAQASVKPVDIPSEAEAKTPDEIREKFSSMKPGPERSAFFKQHRKHLI